MNAVHEKGAVSRAAYDYATRHGIVPISWQDFHSLCKGLALAVSSDKPEVILAVGRGGLYPGTLLAHLLQVELVPIRLSRRIDDIVVHQEPRWLAEPPPALVTGRRVLVVDEICDTGRTVGLAAEKARALGAARVRVAVLYAHSWGVEYADYVGLVDDGLILNPWDREVIRDGAFVWHPEYREALARQGVEPEAGLLQDAPPARLAKG